MRLTKWLSAACVPVGVAFSAVMANGAILADYRFSSSAMNSEALVTPSTASAVSPSGGVTYVSTSGNPGGMASIAVNLTDGTTEAGAITANDYIAFTLTPNPGYALDLADLHFDWVIQRDSVSNSDPNPWTANTFLKSSVGGFGAGDPTLGSVSRNTSTFAIGTGAGQNPWQNVVFDLSSLATSTSPVTFRL